MSWNHRPPMRLEYDSEEDFQEAMKLYEWAEDEYANAYVEERMEREHN